MLTTRTARSSGSPVRSGSPSGRKPRGMTGVVTDPKLKRSSWRIGAESPVQPKAPLTSSTTRRHPVGRRCGTPASAPHSWRRSVDRRAVGRGLLRDRRKRLRWPRRDRSPWQEASTLETSSRPTGHRSRSRRALPMPIAARLRSEVPSEALAADARDTRSCGEGRRAPRCRGGVRLRSRRPRPAPPELRRSWKACRR